MANARHVRLIAQSRQKDDRLDARTLARLARVDPKFAISCYPSKRPGPSRPFSCPVTRGARTLAYHPYINTARGLVKTNGERLHGSSSRIIKSDVSPDLSPELRIAMEPVLASIKALTVQIKEYNRKIIELGKTSYPEVSLLTQVHGVGPLCRIDVHLDVRRPTPIRRRAEMQAVTSVFSLLDATLGTSHPQLHITKEGDPYLRSLLVESANHILGPFGTDSDLRRRWGLALASRGAGLGRKRAIVGVARKLAVVLHHLWVTGEVYRPLHQATLGTTTAAA